MNRKEEMREDIAKRIFWEQHTIMHDHEKLWRECDKQFIYRDCADRIMAQPYFRASAAPSDGELAEVQEFVRQYREVWHDAIDRMDSEAWHRENSDGSDHHLRALDRVFDFVSALPSDLRKADATCSLCGAPSVNGTFECCRPDIPSEARLARPRKAEPVAPEPGWLELALDKAAQRASEMPDWITRPTSDSGVAEPVAWRWKYFEADNWHHREERPQDTTGDLAQSLYATPPEAPVADQIIGQIEDRFPNWKSYRDLIDCIDCPLHALVKRLERSIVTASNDDLSKPLSEKRDRHVARIDAMRDAIDFLRSPSPSVGTPAKQRYYGANATRGGT